MKKYRQRIYYTEADKTLMWERWQKGDSVCMDLVSYLVEIQDRLSHRA
jgi:hypothetical protein